MLTQPLRFTTCQAANTFALMAALGPFIATRLQVPCVVEETLPWPERYAALDRGKIHVGWICGRPFAWRLGEGRPGLDLLAAPVMARARYRGRPVYFAEVVVRADASIAAFAELRHTVFAFNEPESLSGYHLMRHALAVGDAGDGFFSRAIRSGSHKRSIEMVLEGVADAAAIDSTLLEWLISADPELGRCLKVVATLGPVPIPPLVIHHAVPAPLVKKLRAVLLQLHREPAGRALLALGGLARFVASPAAPYATIRAMDEQASAVHLARSVCD